MLFGACLALALRTADRPDLSGEPQTVRSEDGRFLVHYTLTGRDALGGDTSTPVPELVTRALDGLAIGVEAFEARGFRSLVGDGDGPIDVYMRALDINGYATPVPPEAGAEGSSCYMQLDSQLTLDGVMESVAVHELHHCVQYRYTTETATFMYEAGATYEQYLHVRNDLLDLAVIVLYDRRLGEPERRADHVDGEYEYAGFLWMQFLEQLPGGPDQPLPRLWALLEAEPDWTVANDQAAASFFGLDLPSLFLEHGTWNAFACARDDGQHYDGLPCNDIVEIASRAVDNAWSVRFDDAPYTLAYADLPSAPHGLSATCEVRPRRAEALLRLVAVDEAGLAGRVAEGDARDEVRLEGPLPEGGVTAVLASVGQEAAKVDCTFEALPPPAPVASGEGCGCVQGGADHLGWWILALAALSGRRRP